MTRRTPAWRAVHGKRARVKRWRRRLSRLDRDLLARAAEHRSPNSDRFFTGLSTVADNGKVWLSVAALLAATGERRPRTAAASGLIGLGAASAMVNGPLKFLWQRDRPASAAIAAHGALLPLPRTFSFPSGHSASALAFATGVTTAMPAAGPVVLPLAGAVAYSRVHTGVHYPSDVVVGAALGAVAGVTAGRLANRVRASSVERPAAPEVEAAVPQRAFLLSSADSGSADGLDDAVETLQQGGVTIEKRFAVEDVETLAALLREGVDGPILVVAAGGDGTVSAATNAVCGTGAVLGVLPLGTSNDVARSLGVPPHPVEAAQALVDGVVGKVDAGRLELSDGTSRIFMNAATLGVNVAFAEIATKSTVRNRFGGLTYPVAAAKSVRRYVPFHCQLEHDDRCEDLELVHLSISNAPVFGGLLGFRVPGASLTDGLLDVIAIERLSVARLGMVIADTVIGRHKPVRRVHSLRVRSLRVTSPEPQEIALDGEIVGTTDATFTILADALRVVLPRRD